MATFDTIGNAVKTVIDGATLGRPTVVRMDGVVHEDDPVETTGVTIISLAQDQGELWATTGLPSSSDFGTVGRGFVIAIETFSTNQAALETNLNANQNYLQAIKRLLNRPTLSGAGTVWDTRLIQNQAWERQPFREGCEQSSFGLAFESAEPRN